MRRDLLAFLFPAMLLTAGCDDPVEAGRDAAKLQAAAPAHCGGELKRGSTESYFDELKAILAQSDNPARFDHLINDRFWVVVNGQQLFYRKQEVAPITPRVVGVDDWRKIAERGFKGLSSAGYRGCFMDDGKIWLEANGEQELRLVGFNKDMRWVDGRPG